MNKKTMILIMVVSITVVLFMSLWGMSTEEHSEKYYCLHHCHFFVS